jgi:hypothetical protein
VRKKLPLPSYLDQLAIPSNIWLQPIDGGEPLKLTDFKSELIFVTPGPATVRLWGLCVAVAVPMLKDIGQASRP